MTSKTILSLGIAGLSALLAYAPLPGVNQTVVVVSGSELEESLELLVDRFERSHPDINIDLHIQGSQDIVNRYIADDNPFIPTVLIPANGDMLIELADRWRSIEHSEPFFDAPQPIAKTMLVGIAWPERGEALFPTGEFDWLRLEEAMIARNWSELGGNAEWGSFDFVTTDPTRSNSGQLTLSLLTQTVELGDQPLSNQNLNSADVQSLFKLVRSSVYQPPRSTDILLQEFITRGPNEADIATVYESIALYRWDEASVTQGIPYQIYYPNPTVETVSTAAIVTRDVSNGTAQAAQTFIEYLAAPQQQELFVQFGFRPAISDIDLSSVKRSPWAEGIPGAEEDPSTIAIHPPSREAIGEIQRLWERSK